MKYIVKITETLVRQVEIEAEDGCTAIESVRNDWANGKITLNETDDYCDAEFDYEEAEEE